MKKGSIFSALALAAAVTTGAVWQGKAADAAATTAQSASTTAPSRMATGGRDSYADVVKVVTPAVVTIRVEGRPRVSPTQFQDDDLLRRFFGDQFGNPSRRGQAPRTRGLGSGVVVSSDGYLLTNHHVIDNATDIKVEFADGRTFTAKLVGSDQPSDLALLKIEAANLRPLTRPCCCLAAWCGYCSYC